MDNSKYTVYVSSYASIDASGIYAFILDAVTGNLAASWSFVGIADPSFIVLHPNGRWLYAVSEVVQYEDGRSGAVWALDLSDQMGVPRELNHQASGGEGPCHLAIDVTGKWLFVSNYGNGAV